MNQPSGRGGESIDSKDLLRESPPIIGCGEWDSHQSDYFTGDDERGLQIGDIILVREGKTPIALCQIAGGVFQDSKFTKKYLHENYREVKILEWCKDDEEFPKPEGTLERLINSETQSWKFIDDLYKNFKKRGHMDKIIETLKFKKQIILQGPPGTGKTYTAKDAAEMIIFNSISDNKKVQAKRLEGSDQFCLIQFHPAYSYEDFVRGITAKSKGVSVEYKTENKSFANFALLAMENTLASRMQPDKFAKKTWIDGKFSEFVESIRLELIDYKKIPLTETRYIYQIDSNRFVYGQYDYINFSEIKKLYLNNTYNQDDVLKIPDIQKHVHHRWTYYLPVLDRFNEFIGDEKPPDISEERNDLKQYILVLDEINRANLPAVLGELIYALEYRDEMVESMYDIDGDRAIVVPDNLYIIGTMNTADRSVGHIDYAIRRRFAFVDVDPDVSVIENVIKKPQVREKAKNLYNVVAKLFHEKKGDADQTPVFLQSDFKAKDVQIGHSYFIAENEGDLRLKLEYEIKSILREYVKDGVLSENALEVIKGIKL